VMALSRTEFVYSDDIEMLNRSLDYRSDSTRNFEPGEQLQQYIDELSLDNPPAGEDLALAIINQPGRLDNLLRRTEDAMGLNGLTAHLHSGMSAQKLTFDDVLALKLSADLASADKAKIEITFYFRQTEHAAKFAAIAKQLLPRYAGKRDGSPFELKQDVRTRGTPVVVSLEINGIRAWLESVIPAEPPKAEPQK
jgi:hypothetical protein